MILKNLKTTADLKAKCLTKLRFIKNQTVHGRHTKSIATGCGQKQGQQLTELLGGLDAQTILYKCRARSLEIDNITSISITSL